VGGGYKQVISSNREGGSTSVEAYVSRATSRAGAAPEEDALAPLLA